MAADPHSTESALKNGGAHVAMIESVPKNEGPSDSEKSLTVDEEKGATSDSEPPSPIEGVQTYIGAVPVVYQRPNVPNLIRSEIDQTPVDKRVLVMGCGPDGLMRAVRDTTAKCIRGDGPAVELHCEQFGW